jgi:cbb3-type cytochrome oxidase subunit 3
MKYYLLLIVAWVLGMLLYTSITIWRLQKDLPIDYMGAAKAYFKKEIGGYIVSFVFMFIVVFILPELININMSRAELMDKDHKTIAEKAQVMFRIASTILGMFSLHVAYSIYKVGKKAIIDAAAKKGADVSDL